MARKALIEKLKDELAGAIEEVKTILLHTFQSWLNSHALLDPDTWANSRMMTEQGDYISEAEGGTMAMGNMLGEYGRYSDGDSYNNSPFKDRTSQYLEEILNIAVKDIEQYPS